MTEKEIKARYKHTVFGFLWVILNPILQMLVIGFVFSFFVRVPVENYYLFLFSGLLPWQFFSLSLSKSTSSFVYERSLLQKSKFPREVIPLSIILSNFFHFLASLVLLALFLLFIKSIVFPQILYIVPASLVLLTFTVSISLLASALQVRYRDINFFVQSLLILWFYATPIVYNLELIPNSVRWMFHFNPLATIFEVFHAAVVGLRLPEPGYLLSNALFAALVLFAGLAFFKREEKYFVDWL